MAQAPAGFIPDGFEPDPVPAGPTARQMLSHDPALFAASDSPPSKLDRLNEALGPLAHPQTLEDFASLLMLPVDHVRAAATQALAWGAARSAGTAARGPVGKTITATGRAMEKAGNSRVARAAEGGGIAEAAYAMDPKGLAAAATPTVLRFTGRGLQSIGEAVSTIKPTLSVAEEAALIKQGYSPQAIKKIRDAFAKQTASSTRPAPMASHAPTAAPAVAAPVEAAPTPALAATDPATEATKFRLIGQESKEYMRLIKAGKTHQEARDLIEAQRALIAKYGLPTGETTRTAVADRNTSGRWQGR